MNAIQYYEQVLATTATGTSAIYLDKYDQLQIYIPKVVGMFSSSAVQITLFGAPTSSDTLKQMYYYDYVNKTPSSAVITISTGGIYEFPYPGANQYIRAQFDVPCSQATSVKWIAPKTTY